jgi:CubicO group peptidase (beta-lactamase class C family)
MIRRGGGRLITVLLVGVLPPLGGAGCGRLIGLEPLEPGPIIHRNDPTMGALLETARASYPEIPGIAAALIVNDDIYLAVRGVRDTVTKTPLEETDAFPLGWTTTGLTGALLAKEVDLGTLSWETTLGETFPDLFPASAQAAYQTVTVAQLASYTSGLPTNTTASQLGGDAANDYASRASLIERRLLYTGDALRDSPVYPPGTGTLIAGGPVIAAAMLERATQVPYETRMQKNFFEPLGMTHSKWTADVLGHDYTGKPIAYSVVGMRSPQFGVCQSIEDFARFAYMFLRSPRVPPYYSAAADQRLRTAMKGGTMTPSLSTSPDNASGGAGFGFAGSTGSAYSDLDIRPNRHEAILLLTNYTGNAAGSWGAGAQWVADQLKQHAESYFPNADIPPASYPYRTSPTFQIQAGAVQVTSPVATGFEPVRLFDGNYDTAWDAGVGVTEATITVDLPAPSEIAGVVINEVGPIALGGTGALTYGITHFDLTLSDGAAQYPALSGDHVGPNMEVHFAHSYSGIKSASLTLSGTSPALSEFQLLP